MKWATTSLLGVVSAALLLATCVTSSSLFPKIKNLHHKKCLQCYNRHKSLYQDCLQTASSVVDLKDRQPKQLLQPEMASKKCLVVAEKAQRSCEEFCLTEPKLLSAFSKGRRIGPSEEDEGDVGFFENEIIPVLATIVQVEEAKPDEQEIPLSPGCIICYGRIGAAFLDCLQASFIHGDDGNKMVEEICDNSTARAQEICTADCTAATTNDAESKSSSCDYNSQKDKDGEISTTLLSLIVATEEEKKTYSACGACFQHMAEAFTECLQGTIENPNDPNKAGEVCKKATARSAILCPDECILRDKVSTTNKDMPIVQALLLGGYSQTWPWLIEESYTTNNNVNSKNTRCMPCYGRIADALIQCFKSTDEHHEQPATVGVCQGATTEAMSYCHENCVVVKEEEEEEDGSHDGSEARGAKSLPLQFSNIYDSSYYYNNNGYNYLDPRETDCYYGSWPCVYVGY